MRGLRCAVILLAGLALLTCPTPALAQKPRAERPTYTVGEKWIRSDGVYDLIRIEKDLYIFAAEGGREIHLTKDLTVAKARRGQEIMEFDPPPSFGWPLEVGKEGWGVRSTIWRSSGVSARVSVFWKVEAYEAVRVAGGTFKAFKIVQTIDGTGHISYRPRWQLESWYAPEVRQFVKYEGYQTTGQHTANPPLEFLKFQVVAVDRPDTAPLQVALQEPKDQARLTTEKTLVLGKVTAGTGVARVTVALNGAEVSTQEEKKAPKKELALNLPIKLKEGKNVLLVTATDPTGKSQQEARTLFYEKPAPPAAPTPAPPSVAALPHFVVTIYSPRDQARLEQESIALAGLASGAKGVSRVLVTLNGVEVSRQTETTPQPAVAVNLPLKLLEGQNTLVVTATDSAGTIQQEARTIFYEKAVPLTVAFRYPEDRATVTQETSVVAALVTSSKGVAKVSLTLNGAEVHQQSERLPQKSVALSVPVTLREGPNAIVVTASEPDGTVRQEIRTVVHERPKVAALPPPPPPAPPERNRWAVVIGVGGYESPEIPRLRYTVPDAEAIYQVLTGPAGFKKEHVLLLTDKTEKKPTLRNTKWALGTFLARSAKKDDTVLIFFAGHGAPEVDQRGMERDGLAKYLVPSDADPEDLFSSAFPMDDIQTIFGRIEAERVVVFIDSCYSGAAGGRTFTSKKTRASHVDDLFLERLTRSKGRAIITASRPAEVSIELSELGHGIFTYYLIQGLKGAADLNRDGIVTLQELYEYLEQQVTQKSRAVGGNQHPVMKGELEGVLPLVQVGR